MLPKRLLVRLLVLGMLIVIGLESSPQTSACGNAKECAEVNGQQACLVAVDRDGRLIDTGVGCVWIQGNCTLQNCL